MEFATRRLAQYAGPYHKSYYKPLPQALPSGRAEAATRVVPLSEAMRAAARGCPTHPHQLVFQLGGDEQKLAVPPHLEPEVIRAI